MKTYVVGGWVRDRLLERDGRARATPGGDRDWVVVGATPDELLAMGYTPVGRDFPVFLHPATREEYALARTERKTAPGYRGFVVHAAPDVTLEQDLQRRDLTINAIAQDPDGGLIDPFGGQEDLRRRLLRHVGPAFVEDPVRILRLARFAARFADFSIAPETASLLRAMVQAGEVDALVPERVWQELARGLMEDHPARMIEVLDACGALARLAPGMGFGADVRAALERSALARLDLPARFAVLASGAPVRTALDDWLSKLRCDADSAQLAQLLHELRGGLKDASDPARMAALLERADVARRAPRFAQLLRAADVLDGIDVAAWGKAAGAFTGVDAGAIARHAGPDPRAIARAVSDARREAVAAQRKGHPTPTRLRGEGGREKE